jgi:exopolysaccharide biosynthesis protein
MALTGDKLLLYCADSPTTPEALRDTLYKLGAETAIMLDGGGSSQCDFQGKKIYSSRRYIIIWRCG